MQRLTVVALIAFSLAGVGPAAAAPRTLVSGSGSDANPCSRALPCRSFGVAIGAADAGGEVIALTSGGYEPFTISKAVTISAPLGIHASIRSSGADGQPQRDHRERRPE